MENNEQLPPWSATVERAALACVLLAGQDSQPEVDALLLKLRPHHFYDGRNKGLHFELTRMRMEGHAVDLVTVNAWLIGHNQEMAGVWPAAALAQLSGEVASYVNFTFHLDELNRLWDRRRALQASAELSALARNDQVKPEDIRNKFGELFEKSARIGEASRPLIEIVGVQELMAYQPDPKTFLVGADMVSRGELALIAGWAGLGKSRLANTLAFAGARGSACSWMGYEIKRQFKTLVLQCENSMRRLKSEVEQIPAEYQDLVKFSKPCPLQFQRPEFRSELRRIWETWPFDVLVIDHWLEVAREEGQADHMEALDNIWASLPRGDSAPALMIIVHMRKQRGGENWRPKTGRELLSEVSGSYAVGAKARTVFAIQPATMEADDDRIIFDCAKSNNDVPMPMSAWHRRNGAFIPCKDFDFDAWLCPPEDGGGRKSVTEAIMRDLFQNGARAMSRATAVGDLEAKGFAQPTAYRALKLDGKFKDFLMEKEGLFYWQG